MAPSFCLWGAQRASKSANRVDPSCRRGDWRPCRPRGVAAWCGPGRNGHGNARGQCLVCIRRPCSRVPDRPLAMAAGKNSGRIRRQEPRGRPPPDRDSVGHLHLPGRSPAACRTAAAARARPVADSWRRPAVEIAPARRRFKTPPTRRTPMHPRRPRRRRASPTSAVPPQAQARPGAQVRQARRACRRARSARAPPRGARPRS